MKLRHPIGLEEIEVCEGTWKPFGTGIDCHKDMVWVCITEPDYTSHKQRRHTNKFLTTPDGLKSMHRWMNSIVPQQYRTFLLEATSTYHYPVIWELSPEWMPTVINPQLVGSAKRKTDKWDAKKLSHHDMAGTFEPFKLMTWPEYEVRQMVRRHYKINGTMRRNSNAIKTRLCHFGINFDFGSSNRHRRLLRSILRYDQTDVAILHACGEEGLDAFLPAIARLPLGIRLCSRLQLDEIEACETQREMLWREIVGLVPPRLLVLAESVPHIKTPTAITLLSELGFDPRKRFPNIRSLVAYAGFDPSPRISADKITSRIPTAGNRHIRRVVLQVAAGVLLSKSTLGNWGHAIAERVGKRGWVVARNAVGRKLVTHFASVMFHQSPFVEGEFHVSEKWCERRNQEFAAVGSNTSQRANHDGMALDEDADVADSGLWDSASPREVFGHEEWSELGDFSLGNSWH